MSEHVLVTGGAGYIGSLLVPALLEAGFAVTVLDDFRHGANSLAMVCAHPLFSAVTGDCRNEQDIKPWVAKADWVFPLAAIVGAPACERDPLGAATINRDAIKLLLGMLGKDQRVIFPATNSGYGFGEPGLICDERSSLRPVSLYGRTKVEAEAMVMERGNAVSFRLATAFGMAPRMRVDLLVNDFTFRAVRDGALVIFEGRFKRNFIHVRDIAAGFLHGMRNFNRMRDEVYNVGLSNANLSKIELAERIGAFVPGFRYVEAEVGKDPDQRDYLVSNAKFEATGWRPRYSLDDGIAELVKGYAMLRDERSPAR